MDIFEAHPRVCFKILKYLIVRLFSLGQDLVFKFKMKLHFVMSQWSSGGSKIVAWPRLEIVHEFHWYLFIDAQERWMKKDSEVKMISDMQHLLEPFLCKYLLYLSKKGERIIVSSKIKSWPFITHPHPFYFIFHRTALHGKPRGQIVFQTYVLRILHFFFPFIILWDQVSLEHPLGNFLYSQASVTVPDSHNSVTIHYMTHFSPRNLFKNIFLMMWLKSSMP